MEEKEKREETTEYVGISKRIGLTTCHSANRVAWTACLALALLKIEHTRVGAVENVINQPAFSGSQWSSHSEFLHDREPKDERQE